MAADSRTNAGVDYVSTQQKLFDFSLPNERAIFLCTSGNLSVSQSTLTLIRRDIKAREDMNIHSLPTMYEVVRYIGTKMRYVVEQDKEWLSKDGISLSANFLVGGQIRGEEPELYMIYPQGNAIQASKETPFLQIGEAKYGKPILDRILTNDTNLEDAAKSALLSIDSTMKSNISVGPPINLIMYQADSFQVHHELRLQRSASYLVKLRKAWEQEIKVAFDRVPPVEWDTNVLEESAPEDDLTD
jgi:putative proteasome-type protease